MRKMDIASFAPANHRVLRDLNEVMVLNVIREKQPISRTDISDVIGLDGSTISKIVARLLADRLVYEEGLGVAAPQGGRKKRYLHINPAKACAVGVDLRPSGYTVALSDLNAKILRSAEVESCPDVRRAVASVAAAVKRILRDCRSRNVEGIGVSLVGLIDPRDGRVLAGEGLGWGEDVPVGAMLRAALKTELPIYFDNGAWLGALAEIWFGKHAQHPRNLVFVDVGEGIGSGIIIHGQLYHGSLHGAGEFGHIPLHPDGPLCTCGSRGCLEAYAADPVTVRRYLERKGSSSRDRPDIGIEQIVECALKGEPAALETLRETAHYLGRGLLPIIYAINPDVIVLSGAVTKAWDLVYGLIMRELSARVSRFYIDNLTVIPTTLSVRHSLIGAIALVLARSFAAPSLLSMGEPD